MTVTTCECETAGFCKRHQCQKTAHWHKLCQTKPEYFAMWERGQGPGQPHQLKLSRSNSFKRIPRNISVAVVVICHNYGRFLVECLESVLVQSYRPQEIIVIDDASTDDTAAIAALYTHRGVRYRHINVRNLHESRRVGLESTTAEIVCFVDADDQLTPHYLGQGLGEFTDPDIAVVYSDVEWFGARSQRSRYPSPFDRARLQRDNYLHAGSLARREALWASGAFDVKLQPHQHVSDWFLWRRVLTGRWTAVKQSGIYRYRQHEQSLSNHRRTCGGESNSYFRRAVLDQETITLFVPLAGRWTYWPRLSDFFERQLWPHAQTRLLLCDTSQSAGFGQAVRQWLAGSDYPDFRYWPLNVGRVGLADEYRKTAAGDVRLAMCQIYYRLAQELTTEYVWILEDDLLPPLDVCERLLRSFDPDTASVSAAYRSRFHGNYVAWDSRGRHYSGTKTGCQTVGGNGFGCVLLRRCALEQFPYRPDEDFDHAFYQKITAHHGLAKVDWSLNCVHGSGFQTTIFAGVT